MKKLIYGSFFLILIGMLTVGCDKNNLSQLKQMEATSIGDFFDEVSKMNLKTSGKNVIYINYEWDRNANTISIKEVKEAAIWAVTVTKKEADNLYTVECANNDGGSWIKICDGAISCEKLVSQCFDEGGCATVCTKTMAYLPENNTFLIGDEVSDFAEEQKVFN